MIPRQVKKDSDLFKTKLTARDYLVASLLFIVIYQSVMMIIWVEMEDWDWMLLRYSLSNADAMGIAAFALSMWALYLFEKNKNKFEKKVDALELINTALSKAMSPEDLKLVIQSVVEHELLPRVKRMKRIEELQKKKSKEQLNNLATVIANLDPDITIDKTLNREEK